MSTATESNKRKPLQGTQIGQVASDKRDKSIKVVVEYLQKEPKYGKYVRRRSSFQVHDPNNEAKVGDTVQ
ncbi:MAG: uS17 family ribosomal protein, partial [Phycisphaeraceae bacterium]|nr:uS17 family ribosomal protein [Phycisphaeraceae bacterium]